MLLCEKNGIIIPNSTNTEIVNNTVDILERIFNGYHIEMNDKYMEYISEVSMRELFEILG